MPSQIGYLDEWCNSGLKKKKKKLASLVWVCVYDDQTVGKLGPSAIQAKETPAAAALGTLHPE